MNDAQVIAMPLRDAQARRRIREELDVNLLVEAGAGSGKTTELVQRLVALVVTGTATVDRLAAVTFTRKAAGELRERFQARLEERFRACMADSDATDESRRRLGEALEGIDGAFIGTIHAFCARILREHPLDVGLDPSFQELAPEEINAYRRRYWDAYLERLARDSDPALEELGLAGLRPAQLFGLFTKLVENPDVDFPAPEAEPPAPEELAAIRESLESIVDQGMELMDGREPAGGWDSLQKKIRRAHFTREVTGWERSADFFEALAPMCPTGKKGHRQVQKRWRDKALAKNLKEAADEFGKRGGQAQGLVERWYAHRYALAIRLVGTAVSDFADFRRRSGRLDFQDLLLLTARLLRSRPGVRAGLGKRYRYLLVDEFQDTDPLQAEIMLLLASEPDAGSDGGPREPDWREARPRPGALFVVGDPKQSIYRFRRADIQLYEWVKHRFEEFGGFIELVSNFRSIPAISEMVNSVFDDADFLPREATPEQARFVEMVTKPAEDPDETEGVFWYAVHPPGTNAQAVAADDAERLATWIWDRIDSGERSPGDFLVLTRVTRGLAAYARALEARGVPVQVTGAGVGVDEELEELLTLLDCMIDPGDPVKVVAVLVGLFFGLDLERLLRHRRLGGHFGVIRPGSEGDPGVLEALETLRRWWRWASRQPADVFLGRLVPELGVLPLAAAGELGSLRAGALVYALDAVRAAVLAGDASLPGALAALEAALAAKEAEAPLEPGRDDVVRLMNLHQAKGLEGRVVVLADPSKPPNPAPEIHVERRADGSAVGYLRVRAARQGFGAARELARPAEWDEMEFREQRFDAAEQVRLLYVAATRAKRELVVARYPDKPEGSAWHALDSWLDTHGTALDLRAREPLPRDVLQLTPGDVRHATTEAAGRVEAASRPSFRHTSVTEVAKGIEMPVVVPEPDSPSPVPSPTEGFRGYSWGSAVHGALAAAVADDSEAALRSACRSLLVEYGRPLDDHGEPLELDELMVLVRSVRASELWVRAGSARQVLAEVPFAVPGLTRPPDPPPPPPEPDGPAARGPRRQLDLFAGGGAPPPPEPDTAGEPAPDGDPASEEHEDDAVPAVLEGVIDLAFREADGWVVADYKTDVGADPAFPARLEAYRRQVELYAEAWARLTGDDVKERVLFFTAQGRVESW